MTPLRSPATQAATAFPATQAARGRSSAGASSLAAEHAWRSLIRIDGHVHDALRGTHGFAEHSVDALRAAWRRIEDLGFDWISIWDHFYGATGSVDDADCLEAVTMHTALALETSRVQCGALVYSVGFRHPAVLAKAVTAIDLLSGGRAAIGLGAGWAEVEYAAYGFDFPRVGHAHGPARGVRGLRAGPAARRRHDVRRPVVHAP